MKRWKAGLLTSLLSAFVLVGCGGSGGGAGGAASYCSDASSSTGSGGPGAARDPFAAYGKLLLDEASASVSEDEFAILTEEDQTGLTDPVHAPYLKGLSSDSMSSDSGRRLAGGTELDVQLRESCAAGGEISSDIRSDIRSLGPSQSDAPTPSDLRDYTWKLPREMTTAELKRIADADPCVVGVTDSTVSSVYSLPSDPEVAKQGHLKMLEAGGAYSVFQQLKADRDITIAVIDTGIDTTHEDLRNILWSNSGEIPGNRVDDDKNGYVDDVNGYNFANDIASPKYVGTWSVYHHGTHVSGLAAAQGGNGVGVSGVMASGAKVMMLNVFGNSSGAYSSHIANAIRYAADNGADVLNLSVGGSGRNAAYESALTYAVKKGVFVTAAAGNERRKIGSSYFMSPAGYARQLHGMMAVGSVDSSDLSFSTFSNYSSTYVEIAAPGSEDSSARKGVLSTMPRSNYARIQGTSMSAPVAAGAAAMAIAMLRARGYKPGPGTIEGILSLSSRSVEGLKTKISEGRVLNLKRMADYIQANYPAGGAGTDPGFPGADCSSL